MVQLFEGDLGTWGNSIHHPDGDIRNGSVIQSTVEDVARPPRAVSSVWRRERGGTPIAGDYEAACERTEFDGFHSVECCMVGQRHYGDRSCMVVTSSVWCGLFSLTSYRHGIMFRQQLPREEKAGSCVILVCSASVALQF